MSGGRSLLPGRWPDGATFAAAISFDLDHETPWEGKGAISPQILSAAEYGTRRGLPRILDVLLDEGVPASFFIPALAMKRYPEETSRVKTLGHEVALHGLRHERPWTVSASQEREMMEESCEIYESETGCRPRGYRAPSFDPSTTTPYLLEELGFLYDSSLMSDDDPYELVASGETLKLIEIPVEWTRDDATYFLMDRGSSVRPTMSSEGVASIWRSDWHRARHEGGLFQLTLHPDIIGHRSRIDVLAALLNEIRMDGMGWFATHEAIAMHCIKEGTYDNESG